MSEQFDAIEMRGALETLKRIVTERYEKEIKEDRIPDDIIQLRNQHTIDLAAIDRVDSLFYYHGELKERNKTEVMAPV